MVKRIELIANIAIISIALLLGYILIKRHFTTTSETLEPDTGVHVGSTFPLADADWVKNGRTFILAISPGCHYCSENASFYRTLAQEVLGKDDLQLVAISPGPTGGTEDYLSSHDVAVDEIKQVELLSIGITGVPTLLLVDDEGVVKDVWRGVLTGTQQKTIMDRTKSSSASNVKSSLDPGELKLVLDSGKPITILDVSNREEYARAHIPRAINIPLDELEMRASRELPQSTTVVYCVCAKDGLSEFARRILNNEGFSDVLILRGGLKSWLQTDFLTR